MAVPNRHRNAASGSILIVAPGDDLHANAVTFRICQLWPETVRVARLDLATYPISSGLEWHLGNDASAISVQPADRALAEGIGRAANKVVADWPEPSSCVIDVAELLGIWWRRARAPLCHPDVIEPEYRSFCVRTASDTFSSFIAALPCVHNRPDLEARADRKPYQLHLARQAGLKIPETLITTNQAAVLEFERKHSRRGVPLIFKSIANNTALALPTRRLSDLDRERLASLRYAPGIFQEFVDGIDLRVAVLDDLIFCCEWRPAERRISSDIRLEEDARMWPSPVPEKLVEPLLRLHRMLGLTFGIYDFRIGEQGPVFLEVNPSGQWLDMELEGLCPLSEAWAQKLVGRKVDASDLHLPPLGRAQLEELVSEPAPPSEGWINVFPAAPADPDVAQSAP